jgi:ribokinase
VRLAVVGSVNLDLVARAERLPRPGETVTGAVFSRVSGGKGANQAVAAARLGADVRFRGSVGNDDFAEEALSGLTDAGVAIDIDVVAAPTGVALVAVDASGENSIVVAPGANAALGPDDVELTEGEAVLCQLEIPGVTVDEVARQASGFFCLNAAPARPVSPETLSRADLVIVNHYEYEALDRRRVRIAAVTYGSAGARILERGRVVAEAVPPRVDAVDGTGAGDAFAACLAVSRLEGRDWDEALRRACIAGALSASRPGAQTSLPTAAEVDALL